MNKQTGFAPLVIILIIVGILAATGGIYWFYPKIIGINGFDSPIRCIKIGDDDPMDWQTYRNDKYGFQISYPNNLGIIKSEIHSLVPPVGIGERTEITFSNNDLSFLIIENKESNMFEECTEEEFDKEESYICKKAKVNSRDGFYRIGVMYIPECGGVNFLQTSAIDLRKNGPILILRRVFPEISDNLNKIYNCALNNDESFAKIVNGYLEKIHNNTLQKNETDIIDQFNQILSTFEFVK